MDENLIIKSFGPIGSLNVRLKKITILIGDQGTGKSCVAKLFSTFKWLEKDLMMNRNKPDFYTKGDAFKNKLCHYHRIDSFIQEKTFIKYESSAYVFIFEKGKFSIDAKQAEKGPSLPKIMYVPAERLILSVSENKQKLIKELPDSCSTFSDEFIDSKNAFKSGFDLPFGNLHYKYDTLNSVSRLWSDGYVDSPVMLRNASSGIQSALPLCLVSKYLAVKVKKRESVKLSSRERQQVEREVEEVMNNKDYSKAVKDSILKQLSAISSYGSFINIVEEPELNLFPNSQRQVLFSLIEDNNSSEDNMLLITTHSPYTLAVFNMAMLAAKVMSKTDKVDSREVENIIPEKYQVSLSDVAAYSLSVLEENNCRSILGVETGLISANDLDSVSEDISDKFSLLYNLYANVFHK
ncbi:ATP-binding protein [Prevotella denticola]|uniref:ATP-binding protein n=1 Tax=Prevotella denticola TaxID=28129 RepID=UPI001BC83414|nr:ATP-binding protein [Prevotella denticola]QUI93065.1 ATP-binding protein [Prevotella denticola]